MEGTWAAGGSKAAQRAPETLADALAAARSADEITRIALDHAARALDAASGCAHLVDALGATEAAAGADPRPPDPAAVATALRTAASVVSSEGRSVQAFLPLPGPGGPCGVLHLRLEGARADDATLPALHPLRGPVALALQRSRLEAQGTRARERAARLQLVAAALSRAMTRQDVADVVIEACRDVLGASAGTVSVVEGDAMRIVAATGYGPELDAFRIVPLSAPLPLPDALREGRPGWYESPAQLAARYRDLVPHARPHGAWAVLPLRMDGRLLGGISLGFEGSRVFPPQEREMLEALVHQCAQAFERGRLFEAERAARDEAERSRHRLSLLLDASTRLSSLVDFGETLRTLAGLAVETLADLCTVYLREGDRLVARATRARDPAIERRAREIQRRQTHDVHAPRGLGARYREGQPVLVPRLDPAQVRAAYSPEDAEEVLAMGMRSAMVIPLRVGERSEGILVLSTTREEGPFTPEDLALAEELARRAALALENARLLQAARDAETRLENIVRSVPGVVWEAWGGPVEARQHIGFVSDHVETMLGYTVEEWLATPNFWLTIVHPDDREAAGRVAAEHFARGGMGTNQFRWVAKDGRVLDVLTHAVVVKDDAGRPVGMRGVSIDITDRRRAEEQLRLYRRIFASSSDAIAIIDPQGRYIEQNDAHHDLTGYSDEDLAGRTPSIHLGEEVFAQIAEELARTGRLRREVESRTRSGRRVDVDLSAFTMRDAAGEVVCHVGIKRDVTHRKRVESDLRDRISELEAIYRLSEALGRAERVEEVYDAAMDCLAATMKAPRCSILLLDAQGVMRFEGWRNLSPRYRAAVEGHSPWAPDAKDPQPVTIEDAFADPALAPLRPVLEEEGVASLAFIPLTHQGRLMGKFMVYHDRPHEFTPAQMRLAGTIASHLAFGIVRVRAEAERRASESRFRTLIEQSPLATQIFSLEGDCLLANEAWERMWGARREDLVGYNVLRDPQLAAKGVTPALERAFAGEVVEVPPVHYDPQETGKPGLARWVRAIFFPLRGANGVPREIVLVLEDVTAAKSAGDLLRESEQRLAGIFDSLAEGIALFDAAGHAVRLNPAALRILDRREDDLVGASCLDPRWGVHPSSRETPVARVLRTGEAVRDAECLLQREDGRLVVLSVNAVPLRALEGGINGVAASFADVTHRKAAEEALRKSELWLRTIFDNLDEGVLVVSYPERTITNANRALARIFGYAPEEVIGRSTRVLHEDEEGFAEHGRRIAEAFARGETARFEFPLRRKDGATIPTEQTVTLLRNAAGGVLGALSVIRDLTEEKRALAELEAARRQVAITEKLSALGSLVSGVAHEIRTPLAYITNHVYLIQQRLGRIAQGRTDPGEMHQDIGRHAGAVMEGVDRINRIVGELRRFTRLQAGERQPASLDEVVLEAVDLFRATHRGRLHVETDLRPTVLLPLDHLQVQQVVLNLLDNAADAMGRTGAVHVATRPVPGGAELVVADRGPGIPPEIQARMFDPLFTTKREGTGLGLSIVRRIVESHGGSIRVETGPDRGTRFTVLFPAIPDAATTLEAPPGAPPPG